MRINIELLGYWHAGSGRSAGTRVDRIVEKDTAGLPYLSGRTLKGLLRDSVAQLSAFEWFSKKFSADVESLLFGTLGDGSVARSLILPGVIRVGDACLARAERDWLCATEGRPYILNLYREMYQTAIDHDLGVAQEHSLRGIEVAIPCHLEAELDLLIPQGSDPWSIQQQSFCADPKHLSVLMDTLLPLVDRVGAHRTRGLGRAILTRDGDFE